MQGVGKASAAFVVIEWFVMPNRRSGDCTLDPAFLLIGTAPPMGQGVTQPAAKRWMEIGIRSSRNKRPELTSVPCRSCTYPV